MERHHRDAVIVAAVRTPIGRRGGALSAWRPDEMAAFILRELMERAEVSPGLVEDVLLGCATPVGEQGYNVGRLAALMAGFPARVPAVTLNRMCASSDQAAQFASQAIRSGDRDVVIAAGVESMSRVPMGSDGGKLSRLLRQRYDIVPQGISAELMARRWKLSRAELDAYSLRSHERAVAAQRAENFRRELAPIDVALASGERLKLEQDEGPRPGTSLEQIAALPAVFQEDGVVTAGNSSQMSDGAAALLIMAREAAERLGLRPRARFVAHTTVGSDPTLQLDGPVAATQAVLARARLPLAAMDHFEVNEAFASVVLAWAREHHPDEAKLNPRGGGISLGHPLGATGARLLVTMLHALEDRGGRYGLQTMCIGHGMANATIIELEPA
ncbi:MAG: thiolase family protein [Candidatus Tectomicrobia bacterium]|nr:thiolase family protein [Candidatus Tectomicrobia bacterium]